MNALIAAGLIQLLNEPQVSAAATINVITKVSAITCMLTRWQNAQRFEFEEPLAKNPNFDVTNYRNHLIDYLSSFTR